MVKLSGRLDAVEAPKLEEELADIPAGIKEIELDFSAVDYIVCDAWRVSAIQMSQGVKDIMENGVHSMRRSFSGTHRIYDPGTVGRTMHPRKCLCPAYGEYKGTV